MLFVLLASWPAVRAQSSEASAPPESGDPHGSSDTEGGDWAEHGPRPTAHAVRTPTAPDIDGHLDDEVWQLAVPFGDFKQVNPVEGNPESERTVVRVLYDADYLYIGLRFYDSEPDKIVSTTAERDAFLSDSDYTEVILDTFLDRRNCFFFQINPTGSKGDALVTFNGSDFNKPWDGIWDGIASIDEEGWTAELGIPFKTLNFDPELSTWGFNVSRHIGRKREQTRWCRAERDHRIADPYFAGDLTGLEGMRQGIGLDVAPFGVGRWLNDRELGEDDFELDGGLDAYYKLSPTLNLSLTFNTDFAETEVDERQVNLTRFPLFFPERRDFFLQDSGLFEFTRLRPFFSRTIGRSEDGQTVPILAGAKVTGRVGGTNIGLLDVQTDSFRPTLDDGSAGDEIDGQNLFVGRIQQAVGERSRIGGIVTRGDPEGEIENTVWGVDGTYSTASFLGDRNLNASAFFLHSDRSDIKGDDMAFGGSISYPNDIWRWSVAAREVQKDFRPEMGFVRRRDIRQYGADVTYRPRMSGALRSLEFSADADLFTDTDGAFATFDAEVQPIGIEWESGESARIELTWTREELVEGFEISDGVDVPAGDFEFGRARVEFETAEQRKLFGFVNYTIGDFFDGDRTDIAFGLNWRPSYKFTGSAEYEQNDVDLPGGSFTAQVARVRGNFSFTPSLSWNNLIQWDSESDQVGVQSRLRWIPSPGRNVFVVFDETLVEEQGSLFPTNQGLAFKVIYTLRF